MPSVKECKNRMGKKEASFGPHSSVEVMESNNE